jgi:hypothetical protein
LGIRPPLKASTWTAIRWSPTATATVSRVMIWARSKCRARLQIARGAAPLGAWLARGTYFRYALSEAVRATLQIQRVLPGRRSAGKCLTPRPQLQKATRCTGYHTIGTVSRSARSGANTTKSPAGSAGERCEPAGTGR